MIQYHIRYTISSNIIINTMFSFVIYSPEPTVTRDIYPKFPSNPPLLETMKTLSWLSISVTNPVGRTVSSGVELLGYTVRGIKRDDMQKQNKIWPKLSTPSRLQEVNRLQ